MASIVQDNAVPQLLLPEAAMRNHTAGKNSIRTVGSNSGYRTACRITPPAGNDFVAIDAGYAHNLALRSDGTIVGWGINGSGECNVPAGNNFVAVSAGYYYSLALRRDPSAPLGAGGTIVGWGNNEAGRQSKPRTARHARRVHSATASITQ